MGSTAGRFIAPAVLVTALVLSPALGYATTFVLLALGAAATVWWAAARAAPPSTSLRLVPLPRKRERIPAVHDDATRHPLPLAGEGDRRRRWRGEQQTPTLLFILAFALITLTTLLSRTDPTPLLGFTALLFYYPLARLLAPDAPSTTLRAVPLPRFAVEDQADLSASTPSNHQRRGDPPPRSGGGGPPAGWWRGRQHPTTPTLGTAIGLATALLLHFALNQPRAAEGFVLTDPYRLAVTTLILATLALGALFTRAPTRWLAPLGLVAALIVITLTGSRTALIGLPVLLLVTALCTFRRPAAIIATLAVTAALLIAALFIELPGTARTSLWSVLASIAQGHDVPDVAIALRLALYRLGLEQFWASPLFGHGWSEANMGPIVAQLTPQQLSWGRLVHLHNDALQFAVSGGALGLLAWLALLLAPLAGYLTLPPDAKGPAKLHATLVLVIGYLVLGLPDLMLASPLQLTLYVSLTAIVLGGYGRVR